MKTCGQCQVNYPDAVEYCPVDGFKLPPGKVVVDLPPPVDPLLGATIDGRYKVEALLGQGGMGYVYAGRHAIIDKRVAIKVLREEHAQSDNAAAQRFLVEAKAASKIGHQNIVDITDFGVLADGKTYFVMEYLDGPTLGRIMHQGGPVPPLRAIGIAVQIARGLNGAHDKGIVHRDLKPENIFILERDGQKDFVKIVDFGIAKDVTHKKKLTQAGMVLGTPEYMSPEQATGQPLDHRVDQYALGCILYEMLCGEVPFRAETATKTLTQHVFDKVIPPSQRRPDLKIPAALEAILMRAMQKKPGDRFANLKEMIPALEKVEKDLRPKTGARPAVQAALANPTPDTETALEAVRGPARRRRMLMLGGGVVVMLAGVAVVVATRGGKPRPAPPPVVVAQPAPPPPVASPLPAAPAMPGDVEIVLRTRPSGAEVMEGTQRLGVAPLHLTRMRSSQTIRVVLRHAGYREETREISLGADKDIEVVLTAKESKVATRGKSATHSAPVAAPKSQTPPPPPKTRVSDLRNPFD